MPETPQAVESMIEARWIIPVVPAGVILEDHAAIVDDGRLLAILPIAEARSRYQARRRRRLSRHALIPGLVNAHTHAAMTLLRGFADDLPLMDWLQHYIWPAEAQWMSADFVSDGAQLAIAEMLRGGTTCFADMYFFPDSVARAVVDSGIRAQIAFPVFDNASAWGQGPSDYIARGLQVRDDFKTNPRLSFAFGPHAPYTNTDATLEHIAVLAEQLEAPVHIHVHETAWEIEDSIAAHGCRPLARLDRLGLLNNRLQAVHMTQMEAADLEIMVNHNAKLVHCPASNMKLASGRCPVERLQESGLTFAIGTDGAASNNSLDMLSELRLAALLAKNGSGNPTTLAAHEALSAATLGGARTLGLDDRIGSLEAGKDADLAAIDLGGIVSSPVFDPASQIVYTGHASLVSDCWVEGRALLEDGCLTNCNEHELLENAAAWRQRLGGKAGR